MDEMPFGRMLVPARIENLHDVLDRRKGRIDESKVRRVEVPDAWVDTSVFGLLMPMRMITRLGLEPVRTGVSRAMFGDIPLRTYRGIVLTIQGRDCVMDVSGIADHSRSSSVGFRWQRWTGWSTSKGEG
jgi:hypothetical protein